MRASARATAAAQSAALHALQGWKWQTLTVGEALSLCASRASGLTGAEVLAARAAYGRNVAPAKPGPGLLRRVWAQLANALMASLVVAAVVAAVFTDWADFVLISLIIIINVLIGLLTEGKAASAAAALQRLLAPRSTVLRDGQLVVVDTAEVVVGDILHVQAGDSLGADVRFISAASLRCLESALTGESEPVDKSILAQPGGGGSVGDWACCGFAGTMCVAGQGTGVVVGIGRATQIGAIQSMMESGAEADTPLQASLNRFGLAVSIITLLVAVATLLIAYFLREYTLASAFITAVAVAVAMLPEVCEPRALGCLPPRRTDKICRAD